MRTTPRPLRASHISRGFPVGFEQLRPVRSGAGQSFGQERAKHSEVERRGGTNKEQLKQRYEASAE